MQNNFVPECSVLSPWPPPVSHGHAAVARFDMAPMGETASGCDGSVIVTFLFKEKNLGELVSRPCSLASLAFFKPHRPSPLHSRHQDAGQGVRLGGHITSALEANQCGSRKGNPEETRVRGPTRKITDAAPMAPMALRLGVFARMAWECWPTTQPAFFFFLLARAGMAMASLLFCPSAGGQSNSIVHRTNNKTWDELLHSGPTLSLILLLCIRRREARSLYMAVHFS